MEWGLTAAFALIAIAMFVAYWFGAAFIVHEAMEEKDPASRWAMLLGGGVAFIMLTIVGIALLRRVYVSRKTIVERT
nr:MAG: hypothetical protein DIU56_14685 [Pseudomonadota bacterium]